MEKHKHKSLHSSRPQCCRSNVKPCIPGLSKRLQGHPSTKAIKQDPFLKICYPKHGATLISSLVVGVRLFGINTAAAEDTLTVVALQGKGAMGQGTSQHFQTLQRQESLTETSKSCGGNAHFLLMHQRRLNPRALQALPKGPNKPYTKPSFPLPQWRSQSNTAPDPLTPLHLPLTSASLKVFLSYS